MGLPKRTLYATNTDDETKKILLSAYIPEKIDNHYYRPPKIPLGNDMWIPNVLDLKIEEGPVRVEMVESEKETGLWLICEDGYFMNEKHLYVDKPKYVEGRTDKFDLNEDHYENDVDFYNTLHISTDIEMKNGDCFNVTMKRIQV